MCSPSSSADRGGSLAAPSIGIDGEGFPPPDDFPGAHQFILHHGSLLGPCAACFSRTLWAQAAQHAYQESLQLLDYAHRYTPRRLERACERVLLYRLEGLPGLRFILAEDLDQLPARSDAEAIGQLTLPFAELSRP